MTLLMEKPQQRERSEQQAIAQLETIQQWQTIHAWALNDQDPKELDVADRKYLLDEFNWADDPDHDHVIDHIATLTHEHPLHIQVRSDWADCGEELEPAEFNILLCTGGPAVRIIGDIDKGWPTRCRLEHQDWGTPWTQVFNLSDEQRAAIQWYCEQFYFGDC